MRLGEIQHLEVSAISLTARQIHVRNTEEFTVKSKRNRTLPLSESAAEAIAEFSRERAEHTNVCVRESKYLFPNPVGSTLNVYNLVHAFTAVARKVFPSRSIHFHCLRHSFGTRLAMANVPLHMIQKLMGHSSVKVTERYAHTSNMSFDTALAVLNDQGEP
jgi:integrase